MLKNTLASKQQGEGQGATSGNPRPVLRKFGSATNNVIMNKLGTHFESMVKKNSAKDLLGLFSVQPAP